MTNFEKWKNKLTIEGLDNLIASDCTVCPLEDSVFCDSRNCKKSLEEWGKAEGFHVFGKLICKKIAECKENLRCSLVKLISDKIEELQDQIEEKLADEEEIIAMFNAELKRLEEKKRNLENEK